MGRRQNRSAETVWRARLARFDKSKLTVVELCRLEGVSDPSFYQWRQRLRPVAPNSKQVGASSSRKTGRRDSFVPVRVAAPVLAEVEFPNGTRVRVPASNTEALRTVILAGNELSWEAARC